MKTRGFVSFGLILVLVIGLAIAAVGVWWYVAQSQVVGRYDGGQPSPNLPVVDPAQ